MAEQPKQVVYRISEKDNVATALTEVTPGEVTLRGGAGGSTVLAKYPQPIRWLFQRNERCNRPSQRCKIRIRRCG